VKAAAAEASSRAEAAEAAEGWNKSKGLENKKYKYMMHARNFLKKPLNFLLVLLLIIGWLYFGFLQIFHIPPKIEDAHAATFVAAGSAVTVASGDLASVSIPAGIQNNDILIVVVHSRDNVDATMQGDWTQKVEGNGNLTNRLEVFWKRTAGSESAPTVTHTLGLGAIAQMFAFRSSITSGDPFEFSLDSSRRFPSRDDPLESSTNSQIRDQ
jgi:hypothetical protein